MFQTSDPDEVIDHVPDACGGCGSDLTNASPSGVVRRQVHDIPVITPIVGRAPAAPTALRVWGHDHSDGAGRGERGRGVRAEHCDSSPHTDQPAPDVTQPQIRRRPILGGLINEYERGAA